MACGHVGMWARAALDGGQDRLGWIRMRGVWHNASDGPCFESLHCAVCRSGPGPRPGSGWGWIDERKVTVGEREVAVRCYLPEAVLGKIHNVRWSWLNDWSFLILLG